MKKIVFVEKDDHTSYDPVSTFFANKKSNSVVKPPVPKKAAIEKNITDNKIVKDKEKAVTQKVGKKGDYLPPNSFEKKKVKEKEQTVYEIGKNDIKNRNKSRQVIETKTEVKKEKTEGIQKGSPIKLEPIDGIRKQNEDVKQVKALKKQIKEFELKEREYERRLEQFEEKEEKFIKGEQKLAKLQKEHKICGSETKNLLERLKNKEQEMKMLMKKDDVPYNKKRELILMNKINQLKKINRELVARIKNYKGTDLVELSIQKNKADIMNQFQNPHKQEQEIEGSKIQSFAYQLSSELAKFLKLKTTSKEVDSSAEKKFIAKLIGLSKDLSLECLKQEFKMPQCNEECVNIYDEIEKYRSSIEPVLTKNDLNMIITEQNIQLINGIQQKTNEIAEFKNEEIQIWKESPKKFKKPSEASSYYLSRMVKVIKEYEKNESLHCILIGHCFGELSFIKEWVNKSLLKLKDDLSFLHLKLKELEELKSLGETGRQPILLFVEQNLADLLIKVPNLKLQLKEIGEVYKNAMKK